MPVGYRSPRPGSGRRTIDAKCEVLNAIFSTMPIAIGGNVAQRNGTRLDQADTSSSHA